jgi:extracellular elastinolytic metalloproteinase
MLRSAFIDGPSRRLVLLGAMVCCAGTAAAGPGSYLVIQLPPFENPIDSGGQILVTDPADPIASPFGWHDTDGAAGAELTDTRGNNAEAQEDIDATNSGGFRPDGGPDLEFLFPWDPNLEPDEGTNLEAAIVNLFYVANVLHDLTYQYGFDEAAGNFQENNYGHGGLGGDPVQADAQDGGSTNSSSFGTPPDGLSPRMQMSRWISPVDALLTVAAPAGIAGDYRASSANFGPMLTEAGVSAGLELVDDGDDGGGEGSVSDGCEPLIGFTPGNLALIDRGLCEFGAKALNAEAAGAAGVVIVNNRPGILHMGPGAVGNRVTVPSAMVTFADGEVLKSGLAAGVFATLRADPDPPPDRDGALDNGIVAHEVGHGISSRLTGGPDNAVCLQGSEQAGEGWSDFWTLVLTAKPGDTPAMPRTVGSYVLFEDVAGPGPGLRDFPYTTDLELNPLTYADVATVSAPHGVGTIWMSMVWEVYWELVLRYGFDEDLYAGSGGNNLAIQLVLDGMKLQPCLPDFVEARDAVLLADLVDTGGTNQCAIWRGFAKRGLGVGADSGALDGGMGVGDETEDFTVPAGCASSIFADGFESGDTIAWN